ncbi:MAG TPA: hypothetical protein VMS54_10230 [Vicinamibacterales bacterium]|nr:hypothetical protein [Vicinamibacterales bacterium]
MSRFLTSATLGLIVTSIARLASAQDGPPAIAAEVSRPVPVAPAAPLAPAVPVTEAIRLDEYLNRLDQWRNEGRITAAEAARARRLLNAAVVAGDRTVKVPLDASGRIDLLALARGQADSASAASTPPGERLVSRVLNEFDLRMRVKARDMAAPGSLALFDGAPGYVAVPARDLGRIVQSALETTPVGELPGGTRILGAIDTLPNTSGVKPSQTIRELSHLVGDRQGDWARSRVGPLLERHKITAGLLAFGVITGIRMGSPGTARFMDGLGVRLRILRKSTPDARLYTTSRLVYRNGYVLPELDLETGVRRAAGPATIRVTAAGTFGAEAVYHTRGRLGMGARWERGRLFADTNAAYGFPEHLVRTELRGGFLAETGLAISGAVAATFGYASGAIGPAPGRLGFELDLTKAMVVGRSPGEAGLFISTGSDSDFSHADWRAGMVFRLRF